MTNRAPGTNLTALCLVFFLSALAQATPAQTAAAVPKLDMTRFTGTWYEVARYANKREKDCIGNVFTLVALGDKSNQFQIVDSCKTKQEYQDVRNGKGTSQDKNGDGRLKVSFLWPFRSQYWVLALGNDYEWSLIGNPDHKELWVFSRTPALDPKVLAAIEAKATAEGFPSAKLVMTPQNLP